MDEYKINTDEISKILSLYSRIKSPEKRIFAQGYLYGLGDTSLFAETQNTRSSIEQITISNQ